MCTRHNDMTVYDRIHVDQTYDVTTSKSMIYDFSGTCGACWNILMIDLGSVLEPGLGCWILHIPYFYDTPFMLCTYYELDDRD